MLLLASCVTEREEPSRGLRVRPGAGGSGTAGAIAAYANSGDYARAMPNAGVDSGGAALPSGPVGRPATTAAVLSSRVVVEVKPLGSVLFDRQVLPLVSPDGNFAAVEDGDAPAWSVLAALPEQRPASGTRLVVYDLREAPAKRMESPELPSGGLVLGRSADAQGFLVESVREDGSRWIGRAAWAGGHVDWLATGNVVNAHGVLTPQGDLLFSRRTLGSMVGDLVLLRRDGTELVRRDPTGSYDLAVVADDGSHAVAFVRGESGIDAEAISMSEEQPGSGKRRLGATISRRRVVDSTDPAMVYQLVAGLQGPLPIVGSEGAAPRGSHAVFLHPPLKRMVVFNEIEGVFMPLAPDSVSAVRWAGDEKSTPGYFCTTPKDLVFSMEPSTDPDRLAKRSDARVLASSLVPRVTNNPERGMIVIGPMKGDAFRLAVSAVKVGAPTE